MCARCEELEDRVAWLESELGLRREADALNLLRRELVETIRPSRCGSGGTTRVLLALHAAKGRAVSKFALMEASPPKDGTDDQRDMKIVDVWVCHARKLVGREQIQTIRGFGYRLTDAGALKVDAILHPGLPAERRAA